jgi:hypothetical protein
MIPSARRFIPICIGIAALALAGCANTGGATQSALGGSPRPQSVLVSDFVLTPDVVALDRSFSARLERKIGSFPTHERKQRTNERVNDEIVAAIIAGLRAAGLEAAPGSEEGLSLSDDALLIGGRLRAADPASAAAKTNQIGFGAGRGGVVADMTVTHFSNGRKRQLAAFAAQTQSGRKPAAATGKQAAADNAAIDAVLAAEGTVAVKLSPDVEAQARALGRAAGERIVAFVKQQGWLAKAEGGEEKPEAMPDEAAVKLPKPRPEKKPDKPGT